MVLIPSQKKPDEAKQPVQNEDPLLASILGDPESEIGLEPDGEGEGSQPIDTQTFGTGDLAAAFAMEETESKKGKERAEWQAVLRAVQADLPPTVGFLFRSWVMRHRELAEGVPLPTLFSWWILNIAHRDFLADQQRPEDERQYDPAGLYVQDLLPMIHAEVRAEREAIVEEVRQAFLARLQPFVEQKLIPQQVLELFGVTGNG